MAVPEHSARWLSYYDRSFLPWDSRAPASQLGWYLHTPCVCALLASSRVRPWKAPSPQLAPGLVECSDSAWLVDPARPEQVSRLIAAPASAGASACPHCASSRLQYNPGQAKALELCCGTGASVVHLAQHGFHAVGVDIAPTAVDACRATAADAGVLQPAAASSTQGSALFLCADVLSLPRPFTHSAASQLATQSPHDSFSPPASQQACTATRPSTRAADDKAGVEQAPLYDFIYDCQSYHVLRQVDERAARSLLTESLRPGGVLMMLVGARDPTEAEAAAADSQAQAPQPAQAPQGAAKPLGPPQMTVEQLTDSFGPPDWEWQWCVLSRFDQTVYYRENYDKPPLAWWCLLKRT